MQVLRLLTKLISTRAKQLRSLLAAAAALDVTAARAGHARWLGSYGVRPVFISCWEEREQRKQVHHHLGALSTLQEGEGPPERTSPRELSESPLYVPGALHPVLLEPSLSDLPEPPSVRILLAG